MKKALLLITVMSLSVSASAQEEQYDILKKIDAAYYYPVDHGLNDISLNLVSSAFTSNPMLKDIRITFYWKKGRDGLFVFDGLTMEQGGAVIEYEISHKKIKGVWILAGISYEMSGTTYTMETTEVRVNEGINDSLFD